MFKIIWFLIKWTFHICTFFVPLILYYILRAIFGTSYEDKLKNINGIGENSAQSIIDAFPTEDDLRNASAEEISDAVNGIGMNNAKNIKSKF